MQSRETQLCRYHYDSLDQLIGHTPANKSQRRRYYCKNRLATEIQGAMRYSIIQHGDQLLAQQQSEDNAHDTTLLATDQQRSVVHTIKSDHTQQPFTYSPYGHRRPENGLLSLLGFNGERPDPVTGHYLLGNGYRAFNPVLMRFNSPDRLSPFGRGGFNAYAYCLGDPANRRDPNGTFAIPDFLVDALNRVQKILGRPESGPGKISTINTIDGSRKEIATLGVGENKKIVTPAHGNNTQTGVVVRNISTLYQQAFDKIPGDTLEELYKAYDMPPMDPKRDEFNLLNTPISYPKAPRTYAELMEMVKEIDEDASQGMFPGVRPSAIRKGLNIRKMSGDSS